MGNPLAGKGLIYFADVFIPSKVVWNCGAKQLSASDVLQIFHFYNNRSKIVFFLGEGNPKLFAFFTVEHYNCMMTTLLVCQQ